MNAIFWGADRLESLKALDYLVKNGVTVLACVCDNTKKDALFYKQCRLMGLTAYDSKQFLEYIDAHDMSGVDIGFSYLYRRLIKAEEITLCKNGIINFHPSPLPDHRRVAGCCYAVYKQRKEWGVSAHYVNERFDEGPIIKVHRFSIPQRDITGIEMAAVLQQEMYNLFVEIVSSISSQGEYPSGKSQEHTDFYYDRQNLIEDKRIKPGDSLEEINRKIEAFWFPPYEGATIELNGETFTLVNSTILNKIAQNALRDRLKEQE